MRLVQIFRLSVFVEWHCFGGDGASKTRRYMFVVAVELILSIDACFTIVMQCLIFRFNYCFPPRSNINLYKK